MSNKQLELFYSKVSKIPGGNLMVQGMYLIEEIFFELRLVHSVELHVEVCLRDLHELTLFT